MTQDEYALFTGEAVNYSDTDWTIIEGIAESRLAFLLGLDELPETLPNDLKDLLAQFMTGVFKVRGGTEEVASKSIRNFSVSFRENSKTVFARLAEEYGDIIAKYSENEPTINVEKDFYDETEWGNFK